MLSRENFSFYNSVSKLYHTQSGPVAETVRRVEISQTNRGSVEFYLKFMMRKVSDLYCVEIFWRVYISTPILNDSIGAAEKLEFGGHGVEEGMINGLDGVVACCKKNPRRQVLRSSRRLVWIR